MNPGGSKLTAETLIMVHNGKRCIHIPPGPDGTQPLTRGHVHCLVGNACCTAGKRLVTKTLTADDRGMLCVHIPAAPDATQPLTRSHAHCVQQSGGETNDQNPKLQITKVCCVFTSLLHQMPPDATQP